MANSFVLIHTVPPLVQVFDKLCAERLPGVIPFHVLDEPLLEQVRLDGSLKPGSIAQLQAHVKTAERIGAAAVLVTCSTLSPGVEQIRAGIRVFKIDEAMISKAVTMGSRIGVIATNQTTLNPTRQLLLDQAERMGKSVEAELSWVDHALPALLDGDGQIHDQLVRERIRDLADRVDVIVLAQASIARVLEIIPESDRAIPILASPNTAIERVREWFEGGRSKIIGDQEGK
ncbi:MAG: aspartate/glutamate racemase family protein [Chloroflexi bacterium]|nr:aspartate/glutamate racemase family protein [Chloroflexota bacterium]